MRNHGSALENIPERPRNVKSKNQDDTLVKRRIEYTEMILFYL